MAEAVLMLTSCNFVYSFTNYTTYTGSLNCPSAHVVQSLPSCSFRRRHSGHRFRHRHSRHDIRLSRRRGLNVHIARQRHQGHRWDIPVRITLGPKRINLADGLGKIQERHVIVPDHRAGRIVQRTLRSSSVLRPGYQWHGIVAYILGHELGKVERIRSPDGGVLRVTVFADRRDAGGIHGDDGVVVRVAALASRMGAPVTPGIDGGK